MARSFFGLRPEDKEYIYEEIFQLIEHCNGVDYRTAWEMPVVVRKWWIRRKNKELQERQNSKEGVPSKGQHTDPFGRKHGQ